MKKPERIKLILKALEEKNELKTAEILSVFKNQNIERTTIYRDLKFLLAEGKIQEISRGQYKIKTNPKAYIEKPFYEREKKGYNKNFLHSYEPNKDFFLSIEQKKKLEVFTKDLDIDTDYFSSQKRSIENLLIDLSFSSSHLEGNTYSYLDTEVLVNYNEVADNKLAEETQMILNHKKAIEYLLHFKDKLGYDKKTFFEIHQLLGEKLLFKEDLGIIRTKKVDIGRSSYTPIDNQHQLEEEFEIFLEKLNQIKNPFEQSLFILVFIPYFQIFLDINKRTSRMSCNLPLLKNGLGIVSLMQVKKKDYITAILSIYELNDPSLMAKLYTENYLLNIERYI